MPDNQGPTPNMVPLFQQILTGFRAAIDSLKTTIQQLTSKIPTMPTPGLPSHALPKMETEQRVGALTVIADVVNVEGKKGAQEGSLSRISELGKGATQAGGGGEFMTHGPTNLTVGDNPGGQEKITVTPISGTGQTTSGSGGIHMAGGGSILTDLIPKELRKKFRRGRRRARTRMRAAGRAVRSGISAVAGAIPGGGAIAGAAGTIAGGVGAAMPIINLGMAAAVAVKGLFDFTKSTLDAQRELAKFSPAMAMVFANADIRQIQREMKLGEETAGSAGALSNTWQKILDELVDVDSLITDIKNTILRDLLELVRPLVKSAADISKWVHEALEHLGLIAKNTEKDKEGEPVDFGKWLSEVAQQARQRERGRGFEGAGGDF